MLASQKDLFERLINAYKNGQLGHALLFHEVHAAGGFNLVKELAAEILGKTNPKAKELSQRLEHPDLHLHFPVIQNQSGKTLTSANFLADFKQFMQASSFSGIKDWLAQMGNERKLPSINAADIQGLIQSISIKSFQGHAKIFIVWLPEYMNTAAANKLLKVLEEPTPNTYLFLVARNISSLLPTILSRCQQIRLPNLESSELIQILKKNHPISEEKAKNLIQIAEGDLELAIQLISADSQETEALFVQWARSAFMVATKVAELQSIVSWSQTLAAKSRDQQLKFIEFASDTFRKALLINYQVGELGKYYSSEDSFNFQKFSTYVHGENIQDIQEELSEAAYHIRQNANAKMVWLDTSLKITRLLHKKN